MNLQEIIEQAKERVKDDYNYRKGVSFITKGIEALYNQILKDEDGDEEEALEILDDILRINVAKTGSIYLTADIYQVRIGDHSSELNERWKSEALTGSVTGNLRMTKDF